MAHIVVQRGSNEVNLVKKDDVWRVRERNDYPANFTDISGFLVKARDLKITQSQKVGPSLLPRLQLAPGAGTNSAVVVELRDSADKPLRTLLLGKKHMKTPTQPGPMGEGMDEGWPDGRWVKAGNSDDVAVISDPLDNLEPKPESWLNKDFFKVEKARLVAVGFPEPTNSWQVSRESETGEWKLADAKPGEQLDSSKTAALSSPLSSPTFDDVTPGNKLDGSGTNRPTLLKIDTFDNFHYTINIGGKTNDDYLMTVAVTGDIAKERTAGKDEKPEDKTRLDKEFKDSQQKLADKLKQEQTYGAWTYRVSTWTLEPILKERSQLLAEKKTETAMTNSLPLDALATNIVDKVAEPKP